MVIIRATTRHMIRHLTESLKPSTHIHYLCCMLQLNSLSHYIVLHQRLCHYRQVVATYPLCHCLSFYTSFFSLVICFIFFDLIIDVCARGFFRRIVIWVTTFTICINTISLFSLSGSSNWREKLIFIKP